MADPVLVALSSEFSRNARHRGADYAAASRVKLLQDGGPGSGRVTAIVRGTFQYDVLVSREERHDGLAFIVECTCPQFTDNDLACKHLWATLVAADARGLLGGLPDGQAAYLEFLNPLDDPDPAELDEDIEVDSRSLGRGRARRVRPPQAPVPPGATFLAELDRGLTEIASVAPVPFRYGHGELMYVIEPAQPHVHGLQLTTHWRVRKKNGEWGSFKPAPVGPQETESAPPGDRPILAALVGARQQYGWGGYGGGDWQASATSFVLTRPIAEHVVPLAAQSGRLGARVVPGGDVALLGWDSGEPWRFVLDVVATERGFSLSGSFARSDERLSLGAVWMILANSFLVEAGRIGRIVLPRREDGLLIGLLARNGSLDVARDDAARLADALARAGVPADRLPDELRFSEVDVDPSPRLCLTEAHRYGTNPRLEARVEFDYDGVIVPDDGRPTTSDAVSRRIVRRRPDKEQAARYRLTDAGLRASFDYHSRRQVLWLSHTHLPRIVRVLTAEGWRVEAEGRVWRTPRQVTMSVTSGIDWFDLEAAIEFGDTQADLPRVLAALRRGESFVRLDDGSVGMVPEDWLRRYAPIAATGEERDGRLRFRTSQAVLLDALLAAQAEQAHVTLDDGFRRIRTALQRFDHTGPGEAPATFTGTLRPYQRDAIGWFHFLRRFGFGGCLADDMGLGKTVMVLALLAWRREEFLRHGEGPRTSAIVVPRSLVANWISEAARFAPDLRVVDYSRTGRGHHADAMADADLVLMTYGTLRRDAVAVKDVEFEYVILDEAQAIKNAASVSAKSARLLRGRHRLALSGTPIENHLGELWSLFEFLNPGLLGSSSFFQKTTAKAKPDPETVALLSRGLRPFFLRRTKGQVARDLPARTEQTIRCELDKPGRALYDGLRAHYREVLLKRIDRVGLAKSGLQVLEALLRLRQAACHPGLVDNTKRAEGSAKFDVLLPRLREVVAEGHKALVFSQFTSLLSLLREALDAEAIPYEYLDGKTKNRAARVDRFQADPDIRLFLISLKAGGVGLNLTAAEYVFLLDPWWNPAVEAQAIDRTHRIGQTREVFAYRIIAADSVEEKVLELQQSKRALADAVLSESVAGLRHLTRDDVEMLLS